jgi:hypothetical protein
VLFRYGVVVLIGLTPVAEDEVLRGLRPRVHGPFSIVDTESATIEILPGENQVTSGGPIAVRELDPPRLLVIADVLAKNVALGRDEREVSKVSKRSSRLPPSLRAPGARRRTGAARCAPSGRRCWSTTGCPVASRSRRSPMSSGITRSSSGFMPGSPWRVK